MLQNVGIEVELYSYVRADTARDGDYFVTVYAPNSGSRSDVLLSARLLVGIPRSQFFTVKGEEAVFSQARSDLREYLGQLADKIKFGTEHPNWD